MIRKENGKYTLSCDYCSYCVEDFEEFIDAVNHKKATGWKSFHFTDGTLEVWMDKCPICLANGEELNEI